LRLGSAQMPPHKTVAAAGVARFSDFMKRAGMDMTAKYVSLHCADNYWTSIDMPTALHTHPEQRRLAGCISVPAPISPRRQVARH
jgi:hypothetical protein